MTLIFPSFFFCRRDGKNKKQGLIFELCLNKALTKVKVFLNKERKTKGQATSGPRAFFL
jgi:hypothetical protein